MRTDSELEQQLPPAQAELVSECEFVGQETYIVTW